MALFPKKDDADPFKKEPDGKSFLSPYETFLAGIFGVCLSVLLHCAFTAGRFYIYKVPFSLLELQASSVFRTASLLFLAASTAGFLQKTFLSADEDRIKASRAMRFDYFFSVLASILLAVYLCCVVILFFRTKKIQTETFFIVFVFLLSLTPHIKARASDIAHTFTTAAFIMVILMTGFCLGQTVGRLEPRKAAALNGEQFIMAAAQNDAYILSGYDVYSHKPNGRIMVLPRSAPVLQTTVFVPLTRKYR